MPAEPLSKEAQFERVLGYVLGNQAAWFIDIGLKAGLLRAVADAGERGVTDDVLADKLGYKLRYVQVWCRGAYAFHLLDWDETSGYQMAPHMESLLLDGSDPQFMGGRIQFITALYEDYRAFPEYLRTGDTWPRSEHEPFILEALKNTTKPDCVMITDQVLPQAPETLARLEAGGRILDIGAGGGHHVIHYARRFPQARVVGLEPDAPSIELARRSLAETDLADRVEIRQGDANGFEDEDAFDLVTMNITLHETGGWVEYQNVLNRVRRALKPGGAVVVSELPYPDSPRAYRENPVYKMYAGVQLHEALVGCGMITQGELRALLEDAQFARVRIATHSVPTRFVMLGEKPG
ncbi:MAG: class I SAM-dependent methyltransferase [Dehalococcoidia bacterium]